MLNLTVRPGERVFIGKNNEIELLVRDVYKDGTVMLGVHAPRFIPIKREKVLLREMGLSQ